MSAADDNSISKARAHEKLGKKDLAIQRAFDNLILTTARSTTDLNAVAAESSADGDDAISNTKWFLIEENKNFAVTAEDAFVDDAELNAPIMDPSSPPKKGCNASYLRWLSLRWVQKLPFRILTFSLIITDLILVVTDLIIDCPPTPASRTIGYIDMTISCYFVLEIILRIYALTPKVFFSKRSWFNIVDFFVVLITFVISVCYTVVVEQLVKEGAFQDPNHPSALLCDPVETSGAATTFLKLAKVLVVFRFLRFIRLIRLVRLYTEHHQIKRAIRQTVSQNKRRYQKDGVDLDLTYVTQRIIAMSFPSSGLMSWYRNPIREVAAFLDAHHGDNYRVYNLCSERTYSDTWFHNRVFHWPVDDHNVPSVKEMIDFVIEVNEWLTSDEGNVVSIHCKGGKGRTGTMICVLLVEFGIFMDAANSLEYFGQRRTDKNVSDKFQGVETASQIRYVTYYEQLKARFGDETPYPPTVWMRIEEIKIFGLKSVGRGDGSDLSLKVSMGRSDCIFSADLSHKDSGVSYSAKYSEETKALVINVPNCRPVANDVRLKFYCSSSSVPKGYEKCAFYFWFHTAFLDSDSESQEAESDVRHLSLGREEIDNPHKSKTWKTFQEDFKIEMKLRICDDYS